MISRMFSAKGDEIVIELSERDRRILGEIPELLDGVRAATGDPGYDILHRPAHRDDATASREFDDLVEAERSRTRDVDRSIVDDVAGGRRTIDRDEALSLLRAINEARLVLAARAGAFDEDVEWERRVRSDPQLAAVAWLAQVQMELMQVMPGA